MEFRSHDASPWAPLQMPQRSLQLADLIRSDMADALLAVEELRASAKPHSEWLGVQAIGSAEDVRALARLLQLLAEAPAVPGAWVERGAVPRLRRLSREQAAQQRERRRLEEVVSSALGSEPPSIDYRAVLDRITLSPRRSGGESRRPSGVAGGAPSVLIRRRCRMRRASLPRRSTG